MALFVIGDPHLSFTVDKPMDVFGGAWCDHAEKLKRAWLETVRPGDTVVLAGDISWGISTEEAKADFAFLHTLPGQKILLKGNHDYWWSTSAKLNRFFAENGWDDFTLLHNNAVVAEGVALCGTRGWDASLKGANDRKILNREIQRLALSLQAAPPGSERVVFFHYPPFFGSEFPFLPLLRKYGVHTCYFGHLHGAAARSMSAVKNGGVSFRLISADALAFRPRAVLPDIKQNSQKTGGFFKKLFSHFKGKC